ncbi:MAG: PilZ domain-containing protein [Acidobacteriota bacterium]|nr:PilZ domain-containing protein [Acidobacteriota bacterium]
MNDQGRAKRIRERLELRLPVRVHCRETPDFEWTEVTRLLDVTPFGAGFTLKRPTERGRLLHMTIPMPRPLRVFDHVEDQYKIWALVRYLKTTVSPEDKKTPCFEVGVAFIGKRPPRSYEEDPARRYEIAGSVSEDGVTLQEAENVRLAEQSNERAHTRHNIPVSLSLEIFTEKGEVGHSESTVTENISRRGATVFSTFDVPVGRFIRLTSSDYNLAVYGVVRGRSKGAGGMPRIHVEFIDREWPVD